MRFRDIANAGLHRVTLTLLRVRLLLQSRWLAHTYQPDPFDAESAGAGAKVRNSFDRWNAFSPHLPDRPLTAIDIGCNDGFFVFRLAARGGVCIGLDHDRNAIMIANARAAIHRRSNALFADLKIEDLSALPDVDVVICLSVFHHIVRHNGLAKAKTIFASIAAHAKSHVVFETGQPDEDSTWARELAFMEPDHRAWVRSYLTELGFREILEVGEFATTVSAIPRTLFVARRG